VGALEILGGAVLVLALLSALFALLAPVLGFGLVLSLASGDRAGEDEDLPGASCDFVMPGEVEAAEQLLVESLVSAFHTAEGDLVDSSRCSDGAHVVRATTVPDEAVSLREVVDALAVVGWEANRDDLQLLELDEVFFRLDLTPSTRAVLHMVDWRTRIDAELRVIER
jgi:hypothetical protein